MSRARDLADGTFSGSFSADSPTLVVDDANNRVGVGTAAPSQQITLVNSSSSKIQIKGHSASNGLFIGMDSATAGQFWNAENGYIRFATNDTERARIDSSGRVTTPYQPSFEAYRTSGNVTTSNSTVVFNNTRHNVGNHYSTSTGNFTAPINGTYLFTTQAFTNGGSHGVVDIQVNGYSRVRMEADTNVDYRSMFASGIFSLSANDVVRIWCTTQPIHYNTSGAYSNFCGYLLG